MEYGYIRVSSRDQNEARQIEALHQAGISDKFIYIDKVSGKNFNRPSYKLLTGTDQSAPLLREGDLLTIYSIDRLGRNYSEIQKEWRYITQNLKADIRVLDMPLLDTRIGETENSLDRKFVADLVLQILSYVAEKERQNIRSRQRQGIDIMPIDASGKKYSAKTGKAIGRPAAPYPDNWKTIYSKWQAGEITATQAMKETGLKKNTFYKMAKYERSK